MSALIAMFATLTLLALCLAPVFSRRSPSHGPDPAEALEAERARLVAAIRDADMDLSMGKISSADHADMRRTLEGEALSVLARLEGIRPTKGAPGGTGE